MPEPEEGRRLEHFRKFLRTTGFVLLIVGGFPSIFFTALAVFFSPYLLESTSLLEKYNLLSQFFIIYSISVLGLFLHEFARIWEERIRVRLIDVVELSGILVVLIGLIGYNLALPAYIEYMASGGESEIVNNFQITDAIYYTRVEATFLTLNYYGSDPVNVSVCWANGEMHLGIMHQGEKESMQLWECVTWMEVKYNTTKVRLEWKPIWK
jgi:hypothetical protein